MTRIILYVLVFLQFVVFPATLLAVDAAPADVKYAAVFYDPVAVAADDTEATKNMMYLLSDPMVGDFALDREALSSTDASPVEKIRAALKDKGENASIGFFYFQGHAARAVGESISAKNGRESGLPGTLKVVVFDQTAAGSSDSKLEMQAKVVVSGEAAGTIEISFAGVADAKRMPSAVLFEALRGNADANRDRKVTVGELVSFLAKASDAAAIDLFGLADVVMVRYRTPAQVVESIGPDKSLDLASMYNEEQRWVESLLVLREIRDARVTDPGYRGVSEVAQLNLALEARYSPDYKKENSARDVAAGLDVISDMLLLANLHYVADVDNRTLFAGGVRNLQLLLDNKRVRKELVPAETARSAGEFALFLKETADHINETDVLTENDFVMRVRRVLMENAATVKLPEGVIITEFIYGIPAALDPNTDFIPKMAYKEFQDDTKGRFGGIGIEITLEDKILTIITPLDGTPGAEAGLLPGDRIVAIEGEKTDGIDLIEAVNKLRGPIGSKVTINVIHRGDTASVDYTITRGEITMRSIRGYAVDEETGQWNYFVDAEKKVGYVRLTDFKENTPEELDKAVDSLVDGGVKALVLDLRFNHGGLLKSGVEVSDRFLTSGTIVTMQGAHSRPSTFKSHFFRTFKDFPIVVLVNDQSASSAEIVAGALQDNKRATLVGARTFGKGTVQTVFELEHGQSALKLTTAKYYTPSGRSIHREPYSDKGGLEPDVVVPMTDEDNALLFDVWHLRGLKKDARERLMEKDRELAAKNPEMKVADPDTFRDQQMDKALEILGSALGDGGKVNVAGDPVQAGQAL